MVFEHSAEGKAKRRLARHAVGEVEVEDAHLERHGEAWHAAIRGNLDLAVIRSGLRPPARLRRHPKRLVHPCRDIASVGILVEDRVGPHPARAHRVHRQVDKHIAYAANLNFYSIRHLRRHAHAFEGTVGAQDELRRLGLVPRRGDLERLAPCRRRRTPAEDLAA